MTPPRFPLDPAATHAVAYAVHLLAALQAAGGHHGDAAAALGMSRRTMDDHIKRLGMVGLQSAIWPHSDRQPRKARGEP